MQKSPKQKFSKQQFISFVIFLFIGGAGGYLFGRSISGIFAQLSTLPDALVLFTILVLFYVAVFVQIILHESGHLVFGLLTGYRFQSFRVGSLMLIKENGRLRLKNLSIAGTGGQCVLMPPAWSETHFPYLLYHLGGALMNFITSALFLALYLFVPLQPLLSAFFGALAVVGLAVGLMNAIPLRLSLLDNDGNNIRLLKKDPQAVFTFYRMLEIHGQLAGGKRLRDLPEEWFLLPDGVDLKNPLISVIDVYAINRLLDQGKIAETAERIRTLFASNTAINGVHSNLLKCDLVYCAMMQGCFDAAQKELDAPQRKFMQSMKSFPSVLRTQYTEALLHNHDAAEAEKFLARFERVAKKYPYPSDIASERDLIRMAQEKNAQN